MNIITIYNTLVLLAGFYFPDSAISLFLADVFFKFSSEHETGACYVLKVLILFVDAEFCCCC